MRRWIAPPLVLALAVGTTPLAASRVSRSAIEGLWKTGCMPIGKDGRHGFINSLEIKRRTISATAQIYAHSNCDTPTIRMEYRGTIADMRPAGEGAIDFDHVVGAITMTADHPEVIAIYNAGKSGSGCGMGGGWALKVARPVNGRFCAPWNFPAIGTRLYERAWVAGDELRIGSFPNVWDNVTPEKRPATPGTLVFHRVAG